MRAGWIQWFRRCLYGLWTLIPLLLALLLWTGWLRDTRLLWNGLLYTWTGISLLVFWHILRIRRLGEDHSVVRGLIAAASLGLPAAGLTLLGFSLSFADLPLALNDEEETLDASEFTLPESPGPPAFLFALDTSRSVIPQQGDSKLTVVRDVLKKVFVSSQPLFPLVPPESCATILSFAKQTQVVETIGQFGSSDCTEFGTNLDDLADRVMEVLPRRANDPNETDLLTFLEGLVARLVEIDAGTYSWISVLIISDLYHDPGPSNRDADDDSDRWGRIVQRMRNIKTPVRFMVLVDDEGQVPKTGFRLRPTLDGLEHLWQEVSLSEYENSDPEHKLSLLVLNLFPVKPTKSLHLRYMLGPQYGELASHIELPVRSEFQNIAVGLVPGPGEEASVDRVRLKVRDREDREILLMTAPPWGYSRLLRQAGSALNLRLTNTPDLGRITRCDLLLAVPKKGRVFRVPLEIVSILPETPRRFFKVLVTFGSFALLALAACAQRDGLLSEDSAS